MSDRFLRNLQPPGSFPFIKKSLECSLRLSILPYQYNASYQTATTIMRFLTINGAILLLVLLSGMAYAQSTVYDLTTDYLTNPLGLDNPRPLLGWKIKDDRTNIQQTAYQIIVASTEKKLGQGTGDLWNTGKVLSDQSVNIFYKGAVLPSRQICYWKVKVWNNKGEETTFSTPARWEMALLNPADWKGKWISQIDTLATARPAPLFRKMFSIPGKKIVKARAYISGLGYYELFLNGKKVGDRVLAPALTRYDKRVKYVTYDITPLLAQGDNVVGVMLGTGWYNKHVRSSWTFDKAPWRNEPTVLCQLEIETADGKKTVLSTDTSWKVGNGPIVFDGILNGERYDARKEIPKWSTQDFNDGLWKNSVAVKGPAGILSAETMPPIRVIRTIQPKTITALPGNKFMVDFGQNMAGRIRLRIDGKAGDEVIIKYGEKLKPDGTLDQAELARFVRTGETQTDRYIASGHGPVTWSPTFTYYGFQYAEIEGYPGTLTKENVTSEVLHTDLKEAGSFSCSNELFNKLQHATRWAFLSNYHGYPTDCPHREKIGWTGDAQLAAELGLYNFAMRPAYCKWIDDFCDEQQPDGQVSGIMPTSGWGYTFGRDTSAPAYKHGYGPQWESAFVSIPWYMFQYYGDTTLLKKYYESLKKYAAYLTESSEGHLLYFGIDDHKPVKVVTEGPILASGFYYRVVRILEDMAHVLNNPTDEKYFSGLGDTIQKAFNEKYYHAADSTYGNGGQTSLSEALYFELTTPENRSKVIHKLIQHIEKEKRHFDAGVLGIKFITNVLMDEGYDAILYDMLNQKDFPSFGNWIEQGATTLWQEWDGSRSLNHIMFGSFSEFFYKGLAGINTDPQHPGFKHFYLTPQCLSGLDWVKASHQSPYGFITSEWTRQGKEIIYQFTIPPNSEATVEIPSETFTLTSDKGKKTEQGFMNTKMKDKSRVTLHSGSYEVRWSY